MLTLSPGARTIIGALITLAIGISSGTVVLTNAIPADYIKPVVAWCGIIAFVGSAMQTSLQALGMSTANKIAAAAGDPSVKQIIATKEVASASPSEKVVSP